MTTTLRPYLAKLHVEVGTHVGVGPEKLIDILQGISEPVTVYINDKDSQVVQEAIKVALTMGRSVQVILVQSIQLFTPAEQEQIMELFQDMPGRRASVERVMDIDSQGIDSQGIDIQVSQGEILVVTFI